MRQNKIEIVSASENAHDENSIVGQQTNLFNIAFRINKGFYFNNFSKVGFHELRKNRLNKQWDILDKTCPCNSDGEEEPLDTEQEPNELKSNFINRQLFTPESKLNIVDAIFLNKNPRALDELIFKSLTERYRSSVDAAKRVPDHELIGIPHLLQAYLNTQLKGKYTAKDIKLVTLRRVRGV